MNFTLQLRTYFHIVKVYFCNAFVFEQIARWDVDLLVLCRSGPLHEDIEDAGLCNAGLEIRNPVEVKVKNNTKQMFFLETIIILDVITRSKIDVPASVCEPVPTLPRPAEKDARGSDAFKRSARQDCAELPIANIILAFA